MSTPFQSSFKGATRRKMIRRMFSAMLPDEDYELYFLLGWNRGIGKVSYEAKKSHYTHQNFVILPGKKENVHQDKNIQKEIAEYDDLVIGDFEDNYENLPFKTLLGYQFLHDRCSKKYDFVSFTDDDAFLDLTNITAMTSQMNTSQPSIRCLKGRLLQLNEGTYHT